LSHLFFPLFPYTPLFRSGVAHSRVRDVPIRCGGQRRGDRLHAAEADRGTHRHAALVGADYVQSGHGGQVAEIVRAQNALLEQDLDGRAAAVDRRIVQVGQESHRLVEASRTMPPRHQRLARNAARNSDTIDTTSAATASFRVAATANSTSPAAAAAAGSWVAVAAAGACVGAARVAARLRVLFSLAGGRLSAGAPQASASARANS